VTDLINQITINGATNTFYGYVNSLGVHSPANLTTTNQLSAFLTAAYGAEGTNWRYFSGSEFDYVSYAFRFPVNFETLSSGLGTFSNRFILPTNARAILCMSEYTYRMNSTNTTGIRNFFFNGSGNERSQLNYNYCVANNHSICIASFENATRTILKSFAYCGWARNSQYSGANYSRGLITIKQIPSLTAESNSAGSAAHVPTENIDSVTIASPNIVKSSPTISCSVATVGANSTELILRDSTSPNVYFGDLWNILRMPSSCALGKIYKNTGIDPDTGVVETGRLRFWMCVGSWGTDKIGMRVYTDNIT
jgi:hypothetical protein